MADPLRIPLLPFQVERFASIKADQEALVKRHDDLKARHNEGVFLAIAAVRDPLTIPTDWAIELVGDEIVCSPPSAPALVKDA